MSLQRLRFLNNFFFTLFVITLLSACQSRDPLPFLDSKTATEVWDRWEEENEEVLQDNAPKDVALLEKNAQQIENTPFEK